jgi:gliding motility-associated-like protein
MRSLFYTVIILLFSAKINAQTLTITSVSPSVICGNGSTDTFTYKVSGSNIPANSNIVIYESTNPSFNPYLGQGDSIAGVKGDPTRQPNGCIKMLGLFIDACLDGGGDEGQNEYMTIASGEGIKVSNLAIDFGNSNNAQGATNADINFGAAPCTFKSTPQAALITNLRANAPCSNANIIPVGPSDSIPPNSIILLFTSDDVRSTYNMSGLCSKGFPIYVLQNDCRRTIGAFSNVSSSSQNCNTDSNRYRHYVVRNLATKCYDSLVYDRCHSQTGFADGTYVVNIPGKDTLNVANGGIKNNAGNSCAGIDFTSDGLDYTQILKSSDTTFKFSVPPSFCNDGFHTIKAILNPPNATQTVSNAITFKLVCLNEQLSLPSNTVCSGDTAIFFFTRNDPNLVVQNGIQGQFGDIIISSPIISYTTNTIKVKVENLGNSLDSIPYGVFFNDTICTQTGVQTLYIKPKPLKPNLGNDTAICGAVSKSLTTGNSTTNWTLNNNPLLNNVASITATQAGTYIATITSACGNVADTIVISQSNTQPKPNLGKDTSFCGTVSKFLSTGITNTIWLKDNVQVATNTATFTATQTGTYIANVTGSCGNASDTIVISQSPNINFDFGTNTTTVCAGGSISLDASSAYDQYLWNTGAVVNEIIITTPGKYWVDVFKNGCKGTDTITVTQINKPIKPNLGNDTAVCGSFTKALTSGNNATVWLKDNVQFATNIATVNVNQTGIYIAKITNSCGTVADPINITQLSNVSKPSLGNDTTFCGVVSKLLSTGNATTTWFRDNVQIASNTASITAAQVGSYVAVINGNCTSVSDTIVISQNSGLVKPFIGNDTSYCGNFSRVLSTGIAQTIWKRNNTVVSTSTDIAITQSGTYIATISNICGTVADTIIINNTNALSVSLGRDTSLCAGQTLTLNATVSGSGITYTWNTGDVSPTITVSALFKKYDVVVSNGVCSATDTILIDSINVPNKPTLGDDTIFCGDFSLLLFTGNNTIWSTGVVGTQIIVTAPGTYIAENKNQCGSAKDTINVTKFSLPNVNIGRDTSICDSIELSVGNGIFNSIFWSTNDTTKSIVVSESGIYTVKVTNTNCSKIDSITIVRDCDFDVYLPTAFSPNNDNVNDVLVPLSYEKGIVVLDFIIYDRWSEKIFEAKNFAPNDKNAGWKGLYKGEFAAVDNYAFYYLVKLPDGKIKSYKGTVALIR